MNNQKCIERLKVLRMSLLSPELIKDAISDGNKMSQYWGDIDHAIAQLEMLDRLKDLLDKAQKVNDREYVPLEYPKLPHGMSVLVGQDEILVAVREFLTGDDKALKILAEVET